MRQPTYRIRKNGNTFKKARACSPAHFLQIVNAELPTLQATLDDIEVQYSNKPWERVKENRSLNTQRYVS